MVVYKDNLKSIADLTRNALENWYQITEKYLKRGILLKWNQNYTFMHCNIYKSSQSFQLSI